MGRRAAGGPTRGRNRAARFALLAAAVTVTIGVFTAAGGASAGGAPTPGVRPSTPVPVACPGTTTVGVFTVTCGGSGAGIASVVENPHGEKFLVGAFYIEARLRDGRLARSTVAQEVYATCGDWDVWNSPILRHVKPGEPIRVEGLVF